MVGSNAKINGVASERMYTLDVMYCIDFWEVMGSILNGSPFV